jgi:pyruvate dehydrogenase E2 component (dihydrolipoyllysine-residue acetyltransferase)
VTTVQATTPGRGHAQQIQLSLLRRAMVRSMVASLNVPCFYLRTRARVRTLLERRAELRASGRATVPSVNDLIVRAAALALRAHPEVNSSYADGAIEHYSRVNVGVAIATDGGLVVPAVYDADTKDVATIGREVRELVARANRRKLDADRLRDPTFTVTNLGMYGIEDFDPLINPPQAAILGVGGISGDGTQEIRLTLGCDHRVLTGAEGASYPATLRCHLELPDQLL